MPRHEVALSSQEARELLRLLEQFVTSRNFIEGSHLTEGLFGDNSLYDGSLRNLYLAGRQRIGKSRAVATVQWENFLGRLGLWTNGRGNPNAWYRASVEPMTFEHFTRMERKLADATNLHPRVKAIIMAFTESRANFIESVRFGKKKLVPGSISEPPKDLLAELKFGASDLVGLPPMKTSKLVSIMVIVMDTSALYTTRDWSVTSVLSTIAGSATQVALD